MSMKFALTLALPFLIVGIAPAGDWPQFRGPNGTGVAADTELPATWSPKENVRWKAEVPGRSVASPVVVGDRVYVTAASGVRGEQIENLNNLHVLCIDAGNGKQLWQRKLKATGNTGSHPKSSMAAPTPVANADGVFVLFATADLAAFDRDGNLKWYRSLTGDYPKIANQVGMASSPILWNDTLIVPMDSDGESFLAGIDTKNGWNLWKTERPKDINWITPVLRQVGDRAEILFQSNLGLSAYDPSNGKRVWHHPSKSGQIPSPVVMGDKVIFSGEGMVCLKPKAEGKAEVVWSSQALNSGSCTPLVYKDHIYNVSAAGVLVCADTNGKEIWKERLKKGKYWASPIAADDKIFVANDEGIVTVVQAGGENPTVLGTNDLKEEIMGTPAIANGAIYIQTVNGLYCIGTKK
jgi:outer membrane protein assembly factor BamB